MLFTIKTIENSENRQNGNAMVYVLIALALFGFLTMTLSRSNDQADSQDISDEQAEFYATELIEYVASAQNVIEMMLATGSEITNPTDPDYPKPNDLNFVTPNSAGFNTPPHGHKVFHPQGGGLNYHETFNKKIQSGATSVWAINDHIDVEWTQLDTDGATPLDDVILTAYFLTKPICEIINEKITGATTIPVTANPHSDYFLATGNTDFDTTECAGCEGFSSLCVEDSNGDYSFYNIIATKK